MTLKETQLRELLGHLVKEVMNELAGSDPVSTAQNTYSDSSEGEELSSIEQTKLDREKQIAAREKLKVDKKTLEKVKQDEKSLKATYDLTRRYTKPNLKKQIDKEKKDLTKL